MSDISNTTHDSDRDVRFGSGIPPALQAETADYIQMVTSPSHPPIDDAETTPIHREAVVRRTEHMSSADSLREIIADLTGTPRSVPLPVREEPPCVEEEETPVAPIEDELAQKADAAATSLDYEAPEEYEAEIAPDDGDAAALIEGELEALLIEEGVEEVVEVVPDDPEPKTEPTPVAQSTDLAEAEALLARLEDDATNPHTSSSRDHPRTGSSEPEVVVVMQESVQRKSSSRRMLLGIVLLIAAAAVVYATLFQDGSPARMNPVSEVTAPIVPAPEPAPPVAPDEPILTEEEMERYRLQELQLREID